MYCLFCKIYQNLGHCISERNATIDRQPSPKQKQTSCRSIRVDPRIEQDWRLTLLHLRLSPATVAAAASSTLGAVEAPHGRGRLVRHPCRLRGREPSPDTSLRDEPNGGGQFRVLDAPRISIVWMTFCAGLPVLAAQRSRCGSHNSTAGVLSLMINDGNSQGYRRYLYNRPHTAPVHKPYK